MNASLANPEFENFGSKRMRWIEQEPGNIHDANDYLSLHSRSATGYYCDDECDMVAVPAFYVVKTRPEYYAAVRDPINPGCAVVDFEESYDDPEEAAHAAHSLAERYAESEREFQAKENARMEAQITLPEELGYVRKAHTRALKIDDAIGARMRAEYREVAADLIKRIRELNDQYNGFKE